MFLFALALRLGYALGFSPAKTEAKLPKLPTAIALVPTKSGAYRVVPLAPWMLMLPTSIRLPLITLMAWALANAQKSRAADAVTARFNSGFMRPYTGTRPATPNTALSGNTLLGTLTFSATAFPGSTNGSAAANAITQDSSADATGTGTFSRMFESDGTTVIGDCDIGTSGSDINFNSVSFVVGGIIQCTGITYAQP